MTNLFRLPVTELTPAQAAEIVLKRRAARERLIPFTEFTNPAYRPSYHHHEIAEHLEAVEQGYIDRLMIFTFPRAGKSELASRRFPPWYMGRNPRNHIIAASYNQDLAGDFGREVKNIVAGPEYRQLYPSVRLAQDSKGAYRWHTNKGGGYTAAGVGTATTGRGANIFLIDDPVKDRDSADSPIIQKRTWDWYRSVVYTRLDGVEVDEPEPSIVIMQTRWHRADLSGLLLEQMQRGGDQWTILDLPAIIDGRALWAARFGLERLNRIKANIGEREWSALYMQRPTPDEGNYFKREWIKYYKKLPKYVRIYASSDYAVTPDDGDYTVHMIFAIDKDYNLYIIDVWREQCSADVWVDAMLDLQAKHHPERWVEEKGPIARATAPLRLRRSKEREIFVNLDPMASIHDKEVRARSIQGLFGLGKVYLRDGAPWVVDLISELLHFPAGKYDDQVDTLSNAGRFIAKARKKNPPKTDEAGRTLPNVTINDLWADRDRRKRRRR